MPSVSSTAQLYVAATVDEMGNGTHRHGRGTTLSIEHADVISDKQIKRNNIVLRYSMNFKNVTLTSNVTIRWRGLRTTFDSVSLSAVETKSKT